MVCLLSAFSSHNEHFSGEIKVPNLSKGHKEWNKATNLEEPVEILSSLASLQGCKSTMPGDSPPSCARSVLHACVCYYVANP